METKPSVAKSALTYGLYLAIATIAYSIILYVIGQTFNQPLGYINYAIQIGVILWALKDFRDKANNGFLQYGTGVGLGTLMGLYSGIIGAIYGYILFTYIDPGLIDQLIQITQEEQMKQGLNGQQMEAAEKAMRIFMKPAILSIMAVVSSVFSCLIISLIGAAIFKKVPENSFEEATKEVE